MAADPEIDAVVELIGGSDGIALKVIETALAHKKHIVTANKALMAEHGTRLAARAEEAGVALAFEAAVAGGAPGTPKLPAKPPPKPAAPGSRLPISTPKHTPTHQRRRSPRFSPQRA